MFENGGKGIGARGKDNGVLVVVAVEDRKVGIEVGYALEEYITDGFAGQTIREAILPEFRSGNYGRGLVAGTTRIINRIADARGVNLQDVPRDAPRQQPQFHIPIGTIIFILFIILMSHPGPQAPTTVLGADRGAAGIAASGRSVEASVAASEDLVVAAAVVVAVASADSVEAGAAVVERRGGGDWGFQRFQGFQGFQGFRVLRVPGSKVPEVRMVRIDEDAMRTVLHNVMRMTLLVAIGGGGFRLLVQQVHDAGRSHQGAVGAGAEPDPAPE